MKFRHLALGVWLLTLIASGWLISRTAIVADLTGFLPTSVSPNQQLLIAQLKDGVASRLILIAVEGSDADQLGEISKKMAGRLRADPLFEYVNNGEAALAENDREFLMRHRYLLSPANDSQTGAGYFSEQGLRAELENSLQALGSPIGGLIKSILPRDPTGELLRIAVQLEGSAPATRAGVWFSGEVGSESKGEPQRALLVAQTRAAAYDADRQQRAIDAIRASFASASAGKAAKLLLTGPAVFGAEARAKIEHQAWQLSVAAAVLVALILLLVYRSLRVVLLSMLPVATGLLVGVAAVGLTFGSVHGITLGFGATLIGEAVDYPSYLFTHVARGERVRETLRRVWPTLRLAVLTTVFGSLAMLLSSFSGLAQLGVLSVAGVLAAGAVTRFVLPTLAPSGITVAAARPVSALRRLARGFDDLRRAAWAVGLFWLLLTAALALIVYRYPLIWDDDLENLSPLSPAAKALDQKLRADLNAPDVRFLLLARGANREQALQKSERAVGRLDQWVAQGLIAGFDMAAQYLPSQAKQARRRAALPERDILEKNLAAATADLPFRHGLFVPFIKDVERTKGGANIALADLQGSALALKVQSLLIESGGRNDGGTVALIGLRGVQDPARLRSAAMALDGIEFLDLKAESNQLVNSYRQQSLRLTAAGLFGIALVLAFGLRSVQAVARVMLPVLSAATIAVALLLAFGERLSLFHLVSLLLVVGIGLNYALFFNRPYADQDERRRTLLSLRVCGATTLTAFGCLALSDIPVLHAIGITVSLGAALALVIAATLARAQPAPSSV